MPAFQEQNSADPVLAVSIRKTFKDAARQFSLAIDFAAPPGFTILFGASGSGKTTLLNCIAGLVTPDAGRIAIGEKVLFDSDAHNNMAVAKRAVGYVLQELALFPHLTVEENAEYGLVHLPHPERKARAQAMLQEFRIDHLRHQRPTKISGGERQRLALVRVLVMEPCLLMLDEPLSALDAATKSRILDDLRSWNKDHGIPILYVTHSREEVMALGERVLVIENGRIIAQGTPHEVMSAPFQESVAQLMGFENIFDAIVDSAHRDRGTMTCRIATATIETVQSSPSAAISLETPLIRADPGSQLRLGIRAGDVLLAVSKPFGLSARNIIAGRLLSVERRDMIVVARVDCGVEMEVHLTLAARDELKLEAGREVWLVIKTHSCHLMR